MKVLYKSRHIEYQDSVNANVLKYNLEVPGASLTYFELEANKIRFSRIMPSLLFISLLLDCISNHQGKVNN